MGTIRKGRGAVSNPEGRFETLRQEPVDDGWGSLEEELPPLETTVTADPARTIISRNDSPDIPFTLSINPYKGCEHGCIYCAAGDTRILMADGRTKALAEVSVGDAIYGTARKGWYRRYVPSRVLAHWRVIKPAYRVTLEDGTSLVTGPDHRFLTERGWKFVTAAARGQRPFLTRSNKLMGTGMFAPGPRAGRDYQLGYLAGMIRGDGMIGEWHYAREGRKDHIHQFRLALKDLEGLERTRAYLSAFGIDTCEFQFAVATATRSPMRAIRTSAREQVAAIRTLIEWPGDPGREWMSGFLAGIFDAEGGYSQGVFRISNTDPQIVAWIGRCMAAFGFRWRLEAVPRKDRVPMQVVRLIGGLSEHLRFFHSVDPAITRKRDISGQAVKSGARLRVVGVEPLGKAMPLYDITTETEDFIANGVVSHNCYARPSHSYLNLSPGLDFETRLFYKDNAAELLDQELRKPGYACDSITLGANTDPYQPVERRLKVTRGLLEVAQRFSQPITIITKGAALVERDLDILSAMARDNLAAVAVSITSLDDGIKRTLEPRAASPASRLRLVRRLREAGVPVAVLVAPVIPFITDAELERILDASAEAGAQAAGYVLLRLPWEVKDLFREWLEVHFPLKAAHVMSLVRQMRGGKDYDSTFGQRQRGQGEFARLLEQRFRLAARRLGLNRWAELKLDTTRFRPPAARGPQLGLDF